MVSKSSHPHSIRFKNELWAQVVARAERDKVTPNEVVIELVREGLLMDLAKRRLDQAAQTFAKEAQPIITTALRAATLSTASPELREHALSSVPLHKPKAFNPQPKKGGKK